MEKNYKLFEGEGGDLLTSGANQSSPSTFDARSFRVFSRAMATPLLPPSTPMEPEGEDEEDENPEEMAGLLSRLTYFWLSPIVEKVCWTREIEREEGK